MPQTPPFHFAATRKLTDNELAQALRLDVEAELDAINLYQSHIDATDSEEAKRVIAYIRDDEKEHAGMFLALLKKLDPRLAEEIEDGPRKVDLILAGAGRAQIEAAEAPAAPARPRPAPLTVGRLRQPKK